MTVLLQTVDDPLLLMLLAEDDDGSNEEQDESHATAVLVAFVPKQYGGPFGAHKKKQT